MTHRPFFKFPLVALSCILGVYFLFTLCALFNNWTMDWVLVRDELWGVRFTLLGIGCIIAGVLRVSSFHPRFATKYAAWLAATPWRPGMELPLGPVSLVLEDLLLIVPLTFLALVDAEVPPWVPVTGYLLGYGAIAVAGVRSDRTVWFACSLIFLASLPVLWLGHTAVLYAVLFIGCVIVQVALSQSLRHFPWDLADSMRELRRRPRFGLAWPFDRVGPAAPPLPIRPAVGFAYAALSAWWAFVLLHLLHNWGDGFGEMLVHALVITQLPYLGVTLALLRMFACCTHYWPPISVWGRLRTGRLIIPGYDYVFVSPLLICAVSFVLPRVLTPFLPPTIVGAVTVALAVAIYFNAGPSLRNWQLTGHHRLIPGVRREPREPKARSPRR